MMRRILYPDGYPRTEDEANKQTNKQTKVRHFWIVWAMESQKAAENSPNKEKRLKLSTRHHS